ncbi:MAG: ParB N-terminal domain-containing protein [Robiginitomaculum sp.]|nr:ParB N-terminal domain-containing protein [Robiginitomaculum sp.]
MTKPLDLKHITLADLHISKLNMRNKTKGNKAPDISDILPSVRERGIRQPLLVRAEPTKGNKNAYGVIAGRRRFYCLKAIEKDGAKIAPVPCCIMDADDDALGLEASILENIARLAPTEMEQYEAFKKLAGKGESIAEIAAVFGITERAVKQRLALGSLSPQLRKLYTDEEINPATIRALTMASKKQQAAWLKIFKSDDYAPQGDQLKAWLSGGGLVTTDKALFPMEEYKGTIITDLFGEHGQFADPDLFWSCQNTVVALEAEQYEKDGWKNVFIGDVRQTFYGWEHVERSKEQGGNVYIEVKNDGHVIFHEGFLPEAEARRIDRQTQNGAEKPDTKPRPEMSGPMAEYMNLHRHSIARAALLQHPKMALRLTVAHMITGSRHWKVSKDEQNTRKEATQTSVKNSRAEQELAEERKVVIKLLGIKGDNAQIYHRYESMFSLNAVFATLLDLDDKSVLRIMTFCMAETLAANSGAVEAVGVLTGADFGNYWSPDEAFFDILRDKGVVNQMVADIAGKSTTQGCVTDTAKNQKQIIKNRMAGHGVDEASPDWLPRWAAFPAIHYRETSGCPPAQNWKRIAKLFNKRTAKPTPRKQAA